MSIESNLVYLKEEIKNLQEIGALRHLILIGSWVLPVYLENYPISHLTFTTGDIDFTIIRPHDPVKNQILPFTNNLLKWDIFPIEAHSHNPRNTSQRLKAKKIPSSVQNAGEPCELFPLLKITLS